jgi:two-component system, chemotaxis family, protein-glutamate methylesterase/glutaminase
MSALRVLVVDDSAFARKVLRESLETSPELEVVGTARDGVDALEKIAELDPDVVTLDLMMPNLDGIGVLKALPDDRRGRVVIVSMADGESDLGIAALALGAFELIHKPTALAIESLRDIAQELVATVKLAGGARARPVVLPLAPPAPTPALARSDRVVLVGTSTGGPQALSYLLRAFPADFAAPLALVVHIPPGYTGPLAARLNADCALEVLEAEEGLALRPGRAIIAQAGKHLHLSSDGEGLRAHLDVEPRGLAHRPSVDVLFESAARCLGPRALGVVLTGMGDDGLAGSRAIVAAGGRVLTQSEASCVVYGMPRVVREAGLSVAEVTLERMPLEIASRLA